MATKVLDSQTDRARDVRIETSPGGLYFQVDGDTEPTCMFATGRDVILVKLSRDDAAFIGKWLIRRGHGEA